MPVSLMSAMAAGLPCVVTDVASHRDVVIHGKTGFIVRDIDDFDRHVRWLIDEPELRRRLGEAARRECRQRFAASVSVPRTTSLYRLAGATRERAEQSRLKPSTPDRAADQGSAGPLMPELRVADGPRLAG